MLLLGFQFQKVAAVSMRDHRSTLASILIIRSTNGLHTYLSSGEQKIIGHYGDEKKAAVGYASAVFKYKGGAGGRDDCDSFGGVKDDVIDLSDVPPQPPIFKSIRRVKEGSSKYIGVYLLASNRWIAKIVIEGKLRRIGIYDNEEHAAVDYARAVFKYKGGVKDGEQRDSFVIDLSDVSPRLGHPFLKVVDVSGRKHQSTPESILISGAINGSHK